MTQREKIEEIANKLSDSSASRGWLDCNSGSEDTYPRNDLVSIAIVKIEELITEVEEKTKQEFRDKFHIDPTKKYHVVGTEKAIIITEWEHHKTLQASLKGDTE